MKQFIYPAVLYYDKESESYAVAFYDINVYSEGETVEEAFVKAKEFLSAYCECAIKLNDYINPPTTYLDTVKKYKDEIVLLVDAQIDDTVVELQDKTDDNIVFDIDEDFKMSDV